MPPRTKQAARSNRRLKDIGHIKSWASLLHQIRSVLGVDIDQNLLRQHVKYLLEHSDKLPNGAQISDFLNILHDDNLNPDPFYEVLLLMVMGNTLK